MLVDLSTAEANTDTAKTSLKKTRPDLKQTSQVEPCRSERLVHSNKRAGVYANWYRHSSGVSSRGFVELFASLFARKPRLISDDVGKKSSKCPTPAELLILVFPIPPGDAGELQWDQFLP
jgi:hypothetical protein